MRSASDFIDALDGSTAVAALLDLPATTVASWKSRNSIPVQHWSALIQSAEAKGVAGITLETLAKLAETRTSPPTAPDQQPEPERANHD